MWRAINKLSGKECTKWRSMQIKSNVTKIIDNLNIANTFNVYLINSVLEVGVNFLPVQPSQSLNLHNDNNHDYMNLECVNEAKVNKILSTLSAHLWT